MDIMIHLLADSLCGYYEALVALKCRELHALNAEYRPGKGCIYVTGSHIYSSDILNLLEHHLNDTLGGYYEVW